VNSQEKYGIPGPFPIFRVHHIFTLATHHFFICFPFPLLLAYILLFSHPIHGPSPSQSLNPTINVAKDGIGASSPFVEDRQTWAQLTHQKIEEFMICAAANKYQNDIKTVSDTARRRQIAENCQKLQSV